MLGKDYDADKILDGKFGAMMDVLVGPMFERGLTRLKERVETK